ncbi:hypothetical protein JCM8097_007738 [Rhodosporidiobolus ruineniae]
MPPSPAASDYDSELSWDSAAESALAQLEQSFAPTSTTTPPSLNSAPTTARHHVKVAIEDVGEDQKDNEELGEHEAARLADALRDFGVAAEEGEHVDRRSLWERFRKNRGWGALSVSDLSGPSWCEVQHSYRLASKPYLPPSERPASILSSSGTSIPINPRRTEAREKVLDGGKAVHARIEREVMGEQEKVEVKVEGGEEWWALRVLNTLVCLETLLETGRVREVPVVGWVRGFLVFGVIDEIERRELPLPSSPPPARDRTPPASAPSTSLPAAKPSSSRRDNHKASPVTPKKAKEDKEKAENAAQRTLEHFFSSVSSPSKGSNGKGKGKAADQDAVLDLTADADGPESEREREEEKTRMRTGLVLSDTKTRYNPCIPPPSESRAARLQLMLYHRLLTALLQPEPPPVVFASDLPFPPPTAQGLDGPPPPFSWTRLYAQLELDPEAPLSEAFLASIQPIFLSSPLLGSVLSAASNLGEFVAALARFGELLRGGRAPERLLEGEMEIVYRLRDGAGGGGGKGWRGRRSAGRAKKGGEKRSKAREEEERELQRAIELSLQESAAAAPPPPLDECAEVADEPPAVVEPVEPDTVDSQLGDSQLPFFANPSLPLPLPLVETDTLASASQAASLPSTAQQFDLPINSQGVDDRTASASPGRKRPRAAEEGPDEAPQVAPAARTPRPASPTHLSASPANVSSSATPSAPSLASSSSSSPSDTEPDSDPSYIGTSTFLNSPVELASWVSSVVRYWRGERAPVGVSLAEVGRCRTCEFEEGCEWRAMKAEEAVEQARARKAAREAAKQTGGAAVG